MLEPHSADMIAVTTAALQRMALTNRSTVPPFRLPALAQLLVERINADDDADLAQLGRQLDEHGLSLTSVLAAQTAAVTLVAALPDAAHGELTSALCARFGQVVAAMAEFERATIERQRSEIERAFLTTVEEQRAEERRLRDTVRELSTPIMPVHEGVIVLPLVGAIDSRRASAITETLLEQIAAYQADVVIVDITGVPVIDTNTAHHLLMTARAAGLLGSRVVLVGVSAEIAQTIVQLGVELHGVVTLANLQAGLSYALRQRGLAIRTA